ncbi:MoaD/ThiS family protein [archaeon]|nr:MoaD/ThiS family protein [archaeon]
MQVYLVRERKKLNITAPDASTLLKKLNIPETTVLVIRNRQLIDEQTKLSKKDKITIFPVVSGG